MLEQKYVLQVAGEVLNVLIEMNRAVASDAFAVRDRVAANPRDSVPEVVAAVVIEALENLWVDPDEAIKIVSALAAVDAQSALQLIM